MNIFEDISLEQASSLVSESLHKSDDGELYIEDIVSEAFIYDDGRLKNANYDNAKGFGVRYVSGETTGYANSTILTKASLEKALSTIINANRGKSSNQNIDKLVKPESLYDESNPLNSLSFSEKTELVQKIDNFLRKQDNRVKQVSVALAGSFQKIIIVGKNGEILEDDRPLVRLNISVIASEGERMETGSYGTGGRWNYEKFSYEDFYKEAALNALDQAHTNLNSVSAPAGEMTVVLGSGWPGVLLHEAVGHGLEGDFNRKGTSAFSNLIGKKVANDQITIVDDGTIPLRRGSLTIDDEGTATQETILIEDGILKGYMQDKMNARLMSQEPTGNGRRESFMSLPMPRMTNTFMKSGKYSSEEIITSVKTGLYMVSFGGGEVDITSGKFVFSCTEGYIIEDGKLTTPIKGATLIGDGPEIIKKISMVGDDSKLDDGIGTCGKSGQSVPVGVGQPTLKIDNITVGGTN
ncbi:MAG: metalloprotease TldD [Pseudomonadota bacterium]|nr:metalloprotease TldD [Pseudomonadota bacterium]